MIVNIGIDIVEKIRIKKTMKKYGKKFTNKILSLKEMTTYINKKKKIEFLSKIFAIKESFSKTISTGFRKKVKIKNIKINNTELKKPYITYKKKLYLTVAHEKNLTIALIIIITL